MSCVLFFFADSFVLLRCDEIIITFRNHFSSGHLLSIFHVAALKFAQTLACRGNVLCIDCNFVPSTDARRREKMVLIID